MGAGRVGEAVAGGRLAAAEGAAVLRAVWAGRALAARRGEAGSGAARGGTVRRAFRRLLAAGGACGAAAAALPLLGQQVEALAAAERLMQGACQEARGEAEGARMQLLMLADLGRASAARLRVRAKEAASGGAEALLGEADVLERAAGVDSELAHRLGVLVVGEDGAWEASWAGFPDFFEQLLGLPTRKKAAAPLPATEGCGGAGAVDTGEPGQKKTGNSRPGKRQAGRGAGSGDADPNPAFQQGGETVPDSEPENETPVSGRRRGARKRPLRPGSGEPGDSAGVAGVAAEQQSGAVVRAQSKRRKSMRIMR